MEKLLMSREEREALIRRFAGRTVHICIDRPIGYVHHKEKYDLCYPINYGYVPGVLGGDGEELDVYLLGVKTPVDAYDAHIIGVVRRENDVEDKLVGAPVGMRFTAEEVTQAVRFQERYYQSSAEVFSPQFLLTCQNAIDKAAESGYNKNS